MLGLKQRLSWWILEIFLIYELTMLVLVCSDLEWAHLLKGRMLSVCERFDLGVPLIYLGRTRQSLRHRPCHRPNHGHSLCSWPSERARRSRRPAHSAIVYCSHDGKLARSLPCWYY